MDWRNIKKDLNALMEYFPLPHIIYFAAIAAFALLCLISSLFVFVLFVLLIVFIVTQLSTLNRNIEHHIDFVIKQQLQSRSLLENVIPLPYVVINKMGGILWYNNIFEKLFATQIITGKNIADFLDGFSLLTSNELSHDIKINNLDYRLVVEKIEIDKELERKHLDNAEVNADNYACVIFLIDVTENLSLKRTLACEKTAVGLIFLDNYDDVLSSLEDFRHSLLIALIDRKINSLAGQLGGIVRKFENDKYLFMFSSDKIAYLKEKKFDILDQVREISIGNHLPVTLSMGIGINGSMLSQSMEYARSAIDLALSRGGDQVLLKDVDKYHFYGGKSKGFEHNTRVRARVKAYALAELIEEASSVFVMGHVNPDFDCFGASIGVYRITTSLGKNCSIILNNRPLNVTTLYDVFLNQSEYKSNFILNEQAALQLFNDKSLLIVVDTHRQSMVESPNVLKLAKKIVVFDHHRKSTEYINNAVLAYHEPYASSTCELITEMLQYIKDGIKLKNIEADALLAGITIDTKGFSSKTGAKTFDAAAYLRRSGADTVRVRNLLKSDMETYKAKASTVRDAEIFKDKIAISVCPSDISNAALVAAQASDELLNISGIEASFVLCHKNSKIIVSARSLGNTNVQVIMEKLGGGGHQSTAGAQLDDATIYSARERVKAAIIQYLQEN